MVSIWTLLHKIIFDNPSRESRLACCEAPGISLFTAFSIYMLILD